MRLYRFLHASRDVIIDHILESLESQDEIKGLFKIELVHFLDLLTESIVDGDYSKMDPVLEEWNGRNFQKIFPGIGDSPARTLDTIFTRLIQAIHQQESIELEEEAPAIILPLYRHCQQFIWEGESRARLERSKTSFVSVAAHELRTPLTIIEGYSAMVREEISKDGLGDKYGNFLDGIDTGTRRLKEVINNLVTVSLIDNKLLELNYQPMWMYQLLSIIIAQIEPYVKDRGQSLEVHRFDGDDELIYADAERVSQALANILLNAIKYTPDGGKIIVDGRKTADYLEITIADTGIGIDPDDHELIFDKFTHLEDASRHSSGIAKFKGGGPGLGLTIARGVIQAHGGSIWVESDGRNEDLCPGSTFHILLPWRSESAEYNIQS